jgi:hypothetical protein
VVGILAALGTGVSVLALSFSHDTKPAKDTGKPTSSGQSRELRAGVFINEAAVASFAQSYGDILGVLKTLEKGEELIHVPARKDALIARIDISAFFFLALLIN